MRSAWRLVWFTGGRSAHAADWDAQGRNLEQARFRVLIDSVSFHVELSEGSKQQEGVSAPEEEAGC